MIQLLAKSQLRRELAKGLSCPRHIQALVHDKNLHQTRVAIDHAREYNLTSAIDNSPVRTSR